MEIEEIKQTKSVKAILATAKALFWKHGIRRISVEELCEKSGVSKMTFYRNFANKYEVMGHLMKAQIEDNLAVYEEIMSKDSAYPEKIKEIIAFKHRESKEISMELMGEIFSGDEDYRGLQAFMSREQEKFMLRLRSDFLVAQREGHIRSDLKVDYILYMLNVMNQHMSDPAMLAMFTDVTDLSDHLVSTLFYGILTK